MKNIAILGATGSIGDSTLSVVDLHPDKYANQATNDTFNSFPTTQVGCHFGLKTYF
jgi:1-deoxy-D-xylulose 5-phosphate reductoisomerase